MTQIIKQDGTMEGPGSVWVLDANGRAKINAHLLDGLHADATGAADAHVVATDASGNVKIGGHVTQATNVIRQVFTKSGIAGNTATTVFTITTTNEGATGNAGNYACIVRGMVVHALGAFASSTATKSFVAHFCRAMASNGTGVNSAVSEISVSASAASTPSIRDIGAVTMAVVETSEFVQSVQFTIDATGSVPSSATVILDVELVWAGYTTPPVMAAA